MASIFFARARLTFFYFVQSVGVELCVAMCGMVCVFVCERVACVGKGYKKYKYVDYGQKKIKKLSNNGEKKRATSPH